MGIYFHLPTVGYVSWMYKWNGGMMSGLLFMSDNDFYAWVLDEVGQIGEVGAVISMIFMITSNVMLY